MFETLVNIKCPSCHEWHVDDSTAKSSSLFGNNWLGGSTEHKCRLCEHVWHTELRVRAVSPVLKYRGYLYAQKRDGKFWHIGSRHFVYLHGGFSSPEDKSMSKVFLEEDESGEYYGWLAAGESHPEYIFPALTLVNMCFPYGPKVEEEKGTGRRIRLSCTEVVEGQ